jgi:hypothetical protein
MTKQSKTRAAKSLNNESGHKAEPTPRFDHDFIVESIRKRRGEKKESAIELFDFTKNWDKVLPHLHHPKVEAALVKEGVDLEEGPWERLSDYWLMELERRACEAIERGTAKFRWRDWDQLSQEERQEQSDRWALFKGRFAPKPDTLDWYLSICDGYSIAPFLRELGKRVYPKLTWKMMTGHDRSFAYGTDRIGNIKVVFDLIGFADDTAIKKIEDASLKHPRYPTLADINEEEKRLIAEGVTEAKAKAKEVSLTE